MPAPHKKARLSVVTDDKSEDREAGASGHGHDSLVEAAGMDRLGFLVALRKKIAATVDDGVPPHALARLSAEMTTLDAEIRQLVAAQDEESGPGDQQRRRSFEPSAI